ncbi:MAG: GAF domain-containing protein [Cytophagales bacterium]|nr:GAF domain-containing protein [Cytophagales bacterium]
MRLNENNGEDLNEVRSDKKIHDKSRFKWTIGRRLQFGFGVLLIIFLISAIYNYYKLNIIEIEARDLIDHAIPVENLTKELESALYRQQIAISKYMELPDHVQKKKYEHQKKEIKHILRELGSSALTDHERALVSSIEIKIKELVLTGEEAMRLEEDLWQLRKSITRDLAAVRSLFTKMLSMSNDLNKGSLRLINKEEFLLVSYQRVLTDFLSSGTEASKEALGAAIKELSAMQGQFSAQRLSGKEAAPLRNLDSLIAKIQVDTHSLIEDYETGHKDLAKIERSTDSLYTVMNEKMIDYVDKMLINDSNRIRNSIDEANISLILFACMGFFLSYIISHRITKGITKPIAQLTHSIKTLGEGQFPKGIAIGSGDEIGDMWESIQRLIKGLKCTSQFAEDIGNGNYGNSFTPLGNGDVLGKSLLQMREKLLLNKAEDEQRRWISAGVELVEAKIRSHQEHLADLSHHVLISVIKYFEANQGAFFMLNDEEESSAMQLMSCYAWDRKKFITKTIEYKQGLIGQCWAEKERIYLTEVPEDFVRITSGLGEATPRSLLILPLKFDDMVHGIIELAFIQPLEEKHFKLADMISNSIATSILRSKASVRTKELLEETLQQAEELRAAEEELKQNAEELQATQEELIRQKQNIEEELLSLKGELSNK